MPSQAPFVVSGNQAAPKETTMDNLQKATLVMTPEQIARWWAKVCRKHGAESTYAQILSDVLDWRHPDPQRLRDEAISESACSDVD
jgi:hypothetical protein